MMRFVRDSDAVRAILAGAGSRPAEELVTALRKGGYLRKYGRYGKPKQHWFRLSHDDRELLWDSSNGKVRSISLLSVFKIIQGQTTTVFRREPLPDYEAVSFSLLYSEGKGSAKERSLDLVCRNMAEFETWFLGIQLVIVLNQNYALQQQQQAAANGQAAAELRSYSGSGSATPLRKQPSGPMSPRQSDDKLVDKLQEFKQIAASLQPVKAALGGVSQRTVSSHLATEAKREIGDCYIWGSWSDAEACGLDLSDGSLQCCSQPAMVANTHALDVIQVAVGARHAALTTRGGEVYTWGAGAGGNMGNGTSAGSNHPQQVARLAGKGTAAVACGHSYTAAVLMDGTLHTWGTGLGGQLGLGPNVMTAVWPTRILTGLEGVRVCQVSCGPYHAAAIGSDGRLFTWGDGLFGKLGHGDHCSSHSPRFVTTLAEHWVISVSCGWWHTAAAAVARARLTGRGVNSSASIDSCASDGDSLASPGSTMMRRTASNSGSFLRGNIVGTSPAPAEAGEALSHTTAAAGGSLERSRDLPTAHVLASRAADLGGAIFTWGGDFRWQQRWSKDHHQGCLGVGDLSGRLVPTLVKGEDNHVQVACGLNFTVALTNNGEVYQMGTTGAQNNREKDKADWKNALVPVLVRGQLSNHTVERLACGMAHVAVVATQRSKANSGSGGTAVTRLLTWGQNSAGQLGIGAGSQDHLMPTIVSAVAGRRILFLTCGGTYTLAVCEHDPRARWSLDSFDEGLAPAPSGSLISSSGPSRAHMAGSALTPGGSSGGPGAAIDRTLSMVANSGISNAVGAQRAAGTGGLTVSASLSSLASSVQSGSRGEPGGGSGGGSGATGLARKSDRGRLESRYSDRGVPAHSCGHGSSGSREQSLMSSKSLGMLTRSFDRSLSGLVVSGGGAGPAQQQQQPQQGAGSHVSWAPDSSSSSRSLLRMGNSSKGFKGSFIPSMNAAHSGLQLQDLSLQALASATKRSHLPLGKSIKKLAMGRSSSHNSSSSRHAQWSDAQSQIQGGASNTRGPGMLPGGAGTPREMWTTSGRSSFRQLSYSARSEREQDLARVSATSSMTSAALSMTPSPSVRSIQEGRVVVDAAGDAQVSAVEDFQRQLRYWQERASNMEQQLSRRNHELESLRREMQFSRSSQGTAGSDSGQQYSCSSLRPAGSTDRRGGSGGGTVGADGGSADGSNLAVRRGLLPLAPVTTGACLRAPTDEGPSSSEVLGQSSVSSSMPTGGAVAGSASATPADASSSGSPSAAAVAAAVPSLPERSLQQQQQQQKELEEVGSPQQRQLVPALGSYPLSALSPDPLSTQSSPTDSMQDAREDWGSPASDDLSETSDRLLPSPAASPVLAAHSTGGGNSGGCSQASNAVGNGTQDAGGSGLLRGSSLASWVGGDTGRVTLLRSRAASLANGGSAVASLSGAIESDQQQQPAAGAATVQQQQQLARRLPRTSTGGSFMFAPVDSSGQSSQQQQYGPSGQAALQEAALVSGEDASPFAVAANNTDGRKQQQQQQRQRNSKKQPDRQQEEQLLQQQQEMFRGMSAHSKEASRVLALFQESQRHRQQLEQQQQAGVQLPLLPPSVDAANHGSSIPASKRPSLGAAAGSVAAGAAAVAGRAEAGGATSSSTAAAGGGGGGDTDAAVFNESNVVAAAGPVVALNVDASVTADDDDDAVTAAAAVAAPLSPAAARELEMLREQNRLLQQQLQELRQQQQQPAVVAALPAPVTVAAGRSSLGPGGAGAAGLGGSLSKHRKTMSVDIGSSPNITHEVAKGVYLSLQALPEGGYDLKRVRFAKQVFSSEDAEKWWNANRGRVYAAFNILQQDAAPTWQQGQQSPELLPQQQPQQAAGAGNSSSAGRVLVSLSNPHPLGQVSASGPTLGGLRELRVKRSSNGDWTPPGTSPRLNSPKSSTLELDTLQLPPSALIDAEFAAAETGQLQQQQTRSWEGVSMSSDGPGVSRSSSLGPVGVESALAGAASAKAGPSSSRLSQAAAGDAIDPQGALLQQQQAQFAALAASSAGAGVTASVLSSAGSGIDAVWQPVLPRKAPFGPAAAAGSGPESPPAGASGAGAAAVSGAPGHKRSGSGLFRWLSKAHEGTTSSNGSV